MLGIKINCRQRCYCESLCHIFYPWFFLPVPIILYISDQLLFFSAFLPDDGIVLNLNHAFCYQKQLHFHWNPLAGCYHNAGSPEKSSPVFFPLIFFLALFPIFSYSEYIFLMAYLPGRYPSYIQADSAVNENGLPLGRSQEVSRWLRKHMYLPVSCNKAYFIMWL